MRTSRWSPRRLAADAGLEELERQTVVDAAVPAAALHAMYLDTPVNGADTVELSTTSGDLTEEIASLAAIGHAFATSALVATVLARTTAHYQAVADAPSTAPAS
ncbi:hypothetical protein [Streptomyces sp. NPDC005322]|uniref:hypothetical protein n=1 Tax=unclassified Streptomyces TaxID=2593676 RepID=UPI0033BBB4BA